MSKFLVLLIVFALVACGGNGNDTEVSWEAERDLLEDRIEAGLDGIHDELESLGDEVAESDTPIFDSRRDELEKAREELRARLEALDEQTEESWDSFAIEVRAELDRIDAMLEESA